MAEGSISQEEYEQIVQVAFAVAAEQLENAEVERENKELEEAGAGAKVEVNAGPAVEWVPDSRAPNCMRCEASFTMLNRKYVTHSIQRAICLKNDIYSRKVV